MRTASRLLVFISTIRPANEQTLSLAFIRLLNSANCASLLGHTSSATQSQCPPLRRFQVLSNISNLASFFIASSMFGLFQPCGAPSTPQNATAPARCPFESLLPPTSGPPDPLTTRTCRPADKDRLLNPGSRPGAPLGRTVQAGSRPGGGARWPLPALPSKPAHQPPKTSKESKNRNLPLDPALAGR